MPNDDDRTASLMTPAKLAQVTSRPRVPVSPAAWLDKMASDAGQQQVHRLAELRADLQLQATKRDYSALAGDLAGLAAALPHLDFGLLKQRTGLLARLTGKAKTSVTDFAGQFDRIDEALQALAAQARSLRGRQGEQARGTDKALLEFEVEYRAIDKIIDSASRWLNDTREQLKAREAQGGDEAALRAMREDRERCELIVARLKVLRAVTTAAQQCHEQAQAAAARRASLVQSLEGTLASQVQEWRKRLAPLANAAREGEVPALSLEGPMDSHRDLQLGIKDAIADCTQMQVHEKGLADSLEALEAPLQAAA
jgi:hypothetical protein